MLYNVHFLAKQKIIIINTKKWQEGGIGLIDNLIKRVIKFFFFFLCLFLLWFAQLADSSYNILTYFNVLFSAMDLTIKKIEKNNNNKRKHILTKKDESS